MRSPSEVASPGVRGGNGLKRVFESRAEVGDGEVSASSGPFARRAVEAREFPGDSRADDIGDG